MKIGVVLPNIPAYSETFFRSKILGLQQNGHKIVLFVNNSKGESSYLNCTVKRAPNLGGSRLSILINSFIQILKAIFIHPKKSIRLYFLNKKDGLPYGRNLRQVIANQFLLYEKLDWLHFGFGTMVLGRENIAELIGAKMAVSFRGYDYYVYPVKNKDCYSVLFSKKVKFHVLSDAMKDGLIGQGISSQNIVKITPAIDINLFKKNTGITNNRIVQLKTVSRLHPIKGLDYVIDALGLLKRENIPFHFSIIGEGKEKERLTFACYQLGISENVSFLGKLSPEKLKEELSVADIYLQYSIQEGFCNAVLEAQALGLLCIVSDAEGLSENVLNNRTGWVVPKRNPTLLAQKIKEIIHLDKSGGKKIIQNASERVLKEFNLNKQQYEFSNFYQ